LSSNRLTTTHPSTQTTTRVADITNYYVLWKWNLPSSITISIKWSRVMGGLRTMVHSVKRTLMKTN